MTPERLVDLLGNPKVADKIVDLLNDPRVAEKVTELLQQPAVAEKVAQVLKSPQVRGAIGSYVELAFMGAVAIAVLAGLGLLLMLYNTVLLRRIARNSER